MSTIEIKLIHMTQRKKESLFQEILLNILLFCMDTDELSHRFKAFFNLCTYIDME